MDIPIEGRTKRMARNSVEGMMVFEFPYQLRFMKFNFIMIAVFMLLSISSFAQSSYLLYHEKVIETEHLIVNHQFEEAIASYGEIFKSYDFIFAKDYKVAAQLAVIVKNESLALEYLMQGLKSGWPIKEIKKNKLIRPFFDSLPKAEVDALIKNYQQSINDSLRTEAHDMFKKDQKMAIKALFRIGQKAKNRYYEEKFAPHSEHQMAHLIEILNKDGYLGEQLINNNYWLSTVLSHHNSISSAYNTADTLFDYVRPKLLLALGKGQISPFEFALIENWKIAAESNHGQASYGYLGPTLDSISIKSANSLRNKIGLRSIELRNKLVDIQSETDIDFYLSGHPWQDGKISVNTN